MKVIFGLGNPGLEYHGTRHNAGFAVVDKLAQLLSDDAGTKFGAHFDKKKDLLADIAKVHLKSDAVLLVKPTTYMNDTGSSVIRILSWYKLTLNDCLVAHDDVSLPLGKMRLQKNGGAGGQHGVESIIECCGGRKDFDRLKVGVGPDPGGDRRADFVLSVPAEHERELYQASIAKAAEAAIAWLGHGIQQAMNQFNGINLIIPPSQEVSVDKKIPNEDAQSSQ